MAMGIYIKVDGDYKLVTTPSVLRSGVYTVLTHAYVRASGTYEMAYQADTSPPDSPELTLQLMEDRYIRVGARIPGSSHDSTVKKIRIMVSRDKQPTSPEGDGGVFEADANYPGETWSNWFFNNADDDVAPFTDHGNTNEMDYKQYPPNPTGDTNLPDATRYYFSAWSQDFEGRWSPGTFTSIWKPKKSYPDPIQIKEATFQASQAGTLTAQDTFVDGILKVQNSPVRDGVFYYGTKFSQAMGNFGNVTIKSAQILIVRRNDAGEPEANVRLAWHQQNKGDDIGDNQMNEKTYIGKINKGEKKWFNIPETFWPNIVNEKVKGFCLVHGPGTGSYMEAKDIDSRCGDVVIHWTESKS